MKRIALYWIAAVLLAFLLAACGGGDSNDNTGTAEVDLTDAPGLEFDNVFITVKAVWFHTSDAAGPNEAGWLRYPLASPKTVDLAHLTDGSVSRILNQILPAGNYQQIRILLVSNEDNVVNPGHTCNNEVYVNGNPTPYPLTVPDAHKEVVADPDHDASGHRNRGIKLVGSFQVTKGGTLRLAIDFDVGRDVVKVTGSNGDEFLLKPRLRYFDLDNVGFIKGQLDNVSVGFNYVIKAEQKNIDNTYRVVRRYTTVDNTGKFNLSFLAPGTYDVLVRGRNIETVIVKGVPVAKGGITTLPTQVPMTAGSEYAVNMSVSPTGSWVNFYQTISGIDNVPFEVRYRHIDPFRGTFHDNIYLSSGQVHVGSYVDNVTPITFSAVTPAEGAGGFKASADAGFGKVSFTRMYYPFNADYASATIITSANAGTTLAFTGRLPVKSPAVGNTISGTMTVPTLMGANLTYAAVFAVHGGLVIDRLDSFSAGPPYTMGNTYGFSMLPLPGGTALNPLPGAFYGVEAIGFAASPPTFAVGIPRIADLRTGNDNVGNFTMFKVR